MIFGWTNYSNARTNVTPELEAAMSTWTLEQFKFFRSTITSAWWKQFFRGQWLPLAMMLAGLLIPVIWHSPGVERAYTLTFIFGLSFFISSFLLCESTAE